MGALMIRGRCARRRAGGVVEGAWQGLPQLVEVLSVICGCSVI